jgi:small subunit ribosomal protein S35
MHHNSGSAALSSAAKLRSPLLPSRKVEGFNTRRCPSRISAQRIAPKYSVSWQRPISSTSRLHASEDEHEGSAPAAHSPTQTIDPVQSHATSSSPTSRELRKLVEDLQALDPEIIQDALRKGKSGMALSSELELDEEDFEVAPTKGRPGFWAEGEESMGPDEDYHGDDLTSLGHGELEQHREMREYARLIAWELPLLSRMFNTASLRVVQCET